MTNRLGRGDLRDGDVFWGEGQGLILCPSHLSLKLYIVEDDLEFSDPPASTWTVLGFPVCMATLGFCSAEDQTKGFMYAQQALSKPSSTPAQKRIASLLFVPEQDGDLGTTTGPERTQCDHCPLHLLASQGKEVWNFL